MHTVHHGNRRKSYSGFTLIEVLVVMGIIAILASVVLVAINPARQFASARNTQRISNVSAILNAVGQRIADNHGLFAGSFSAYEMEYTCPSLSSGTTYLIADSSYGSTDSINLACLVPTYLPNALPTDPSDTRAFWTDTEHYNTGYHIKVDAQGRYIVSAPAAELGETIEITR